MDRLWAPWRISYFKAKKSKSCLFCGVSQANSKRDYLVFKTSHSFCLLNIFPYNNGHLMVLPRRHVRDMDHLKEEELLDLCRAVSLAKNLLHKVLKPQGFNIGINLGTAAGAGIPGHLHIHIVPRWKGDTNFMPVLGQTKIISQSLAELHKQLLHAYAKTN